MKVLLILVSSLWLNVFLFCTILTRALAQSPAPGSPQAELSRCAALSANQNSSNTQIPDDLEWAEWLRAAGQLEEAIRLFNRIINRGDAIAEVYYGLGLALTQKIDREYDINPHAYQREDALEAEAAFRQAISLSPRDQMYMSLGRILIYLDRNEEAEKAFAYADCLNPLMRQLAQAPESSTAQDFADAGRWLRRQRRYEKALQMYNVAVEKLRNEESVNGSALDKLFAEVYNGRGTVLHDLGNVDAAIEDYQQSIELIPVPATYINLINLLREAGRRELLTQTYENAKTFLSNQLDEVEKFPYREYTNDNIVDFFTNRATFIAENRAYYALYIDLLMDWHRDVPQAGFDQFALQISQRARARSLLEILNTTTAEESEYPISADPNLVRQEKNLQEEIYRNGEQLERSVSQIQQLSQSSLPDARGRKQRLLEQIERLEAERDDLIEQRNQLVKVLEQVDPSYANILQPQTLSIEDIQMLLPTDDEETLVLHYWLGEARSYLWVISRNRVTSHELPPGPEIERLARKVHSGISKGRAMNIVDDAGELREILLGPVEDQLDDQRLLIVADGALNYLPFAALPDERLQISESFYEKWPTPLIKNHQVVHLPSMQALQSILDRQHQVSQIPKLAVIANPVFTLGAEQRFTSESDNTSTPLLRNHEGQLFWAQEEAERILEEADKAELEDPLSLVGFDANRENVLGDSLQSYDIIHFATHGILSDTDITQSGLELSKFSPDERGIESLLSFSDIFSIDLNASLVVLSACETGLGEVLRGEGVIGLTQAFMYAGADSVVVSFWPVQDQSTHELMAGFYNELLAQGETAAESLRQAQLDVYNDSDSGDPFLWAAFTLQGRWDQVFEVD